MPDGNMSFYIINHYLEKNCHVSLTLGPVVKLVIRGHYRYYRISRDLVPESIQKAHGHARKIFRDELLDFLNCVFAVLQHHIFPASDSSSDQYRQNGTVVNNNWGGGENYLIRMHV